MSIQIKSLVCPQCGSSGSSKLTGTPNLYACKNCKAEFVLSDSNAPKEVRVVHSMEPGQFAKLRNFKLALAVGAGLFMLVLLLPLVLNLWKKAAPPALDIGRLEESTVYAAEGGKLGFVRVLETGNQQKDLYRIFVTDLSSGKKLAETQDIEFQRNTRSRHPRIEHFSDGNVYLILNGRQLLRLDPAGARFVSLDNELVNRFPQQLSAGVAKIEFTPRNRPDSFEVTSNTGEEYNVYWLTGEILPARGAYQHFIDRPFASYAATQKRVDFATLRSDKDNSSSDPGMLVAYEQKVRPGEYLNLPDLNLYNTANSGILSMPERYTLLTPEWAFDARSVKEKGLVSLKIVPPGQKRFRGEILAENATRILLAYNATPVTEQGRVLQLLDATSYEVVWSRPMDQVPQITRNGTYVRADPIPSGFYIKSDQSTPSLLIDNNGNTAHDFRPASKD